MFFIIFLSYPRLDSCHKDIVYKSNTIRKHLTSSEPSSEQPPTLVETSSVRYRGRLVRVS